MTADPKTTLFIINWKDVRLYDIRGNVEVISSSLVLLETRTNTNFASVPDDDNDNSDNQFQILNPSHQYMI